MRDQNEQNEFVQLCAMTDPKHRLDFEYEVASIALRYGINFVECVDWLKESGIIDHVSDILTQAVCNMYHTRKTTKELIS